MKGEIQALVTELRDLGDNKTIVLYTNDIRLYRKLWDSAKLIMVVPYEQVQGGKVSVVGVDLYFPKKYRNWLKNYIMKLRSQARGVIFR